jgi:hypothetical protein
MPDPHDSFRDYNDELSQIDDSVSGGQLPEQESPFNSQSYGFSNNSNNNNLAKNGNLQKAWNGGNKNNSGINAGKNDSRKTSTNADGISRKTGGGSTGNPRNPMNYLGGSGKGGTSRNSKSRLNVKAKIRRRIIGGILASALGLGGIGIGFAGPSLLAGKILDVIEKRFIAPTSKAISDHTKNLWKCKLSASCSKAVDEKTGDTGEDGKGMGQVSEEAEQSLKNNGGELTKPSGDTDGHIKLANGDEVGTGGNGTQDIEKMLPVAENEFRSASPATNGDAGAMSGEPTADVMKITGANKNIPLEDGVGNDKDGKPRTIQEQLDAQAEATKDPNNPRAPPNDLTVQSAEAVDGGTVPDFAKSSTSGDEEETPSNSNSGFKEPTGGSENVENAKSVETRSNSAIEDGAAKASKSANALGLFMGLACGANSTAKAMVLGIKLQKILATAKFAYMFLTVMNSVQAADGSGRPGTNGPTPEQFSQLMNSLTTVMKDKNGNITTKSGTDSFGYQAAVGYLTPGNSGKFDLTNTKNSANTGQPSSFTSSVITNGQTGDSQNWFTALFTKAPQLQTVLGNTGCLAAQTAVSAVQAVAEGSDLLTIADPVSDIANLVGFGAGLLQNITGFFGNNEITENIDKGLGVISSLGACTAAVASAGVGTAGCILTVIGTAAAFVLPGLINDYVKGFAGKFLQNPMPVGENAMNAIVSGAGASMGMNAAGNGVPVVGAGQPTGSQGSGYIQLNKELTAYNQQQDAIKRVGASPFDIYNQATFAGSIMGNFAAALYANGNTPSEMLGSLFGMFGTGFANFANGTSAMADAASDAYASSCGDSDITTAKIAADPFCNPIYGLSNSDTMGVEETMSAITDTSVFQPASGETSAIDPNGSKFDKTYGLNTDVAIAGAGGDFGGSITIGTFIDECVSRNSDKKRFTPMGSAADGQDSGSNCAFGNSQKYGGDQNLKVLYNYIQYYLANNNINQGSNLGCQADGSCANSSSSSTATSGSAQDLAKKILANPNITFTGGALDGKVDMEQAAQNGTFPTAGNGSSAIKNPPANAQLLGLIQGLSSNWKIQIGVITTNHPSDGFAHDKGNAIDLNGATQITGGSCSTTFQYSSQADGDCIMKFANAVATAAQNSNISNVFLNQIGGICPYTTVVPGIGTYEDACNHLHIGIGQ